MYQTKSLSASCTLKDDDPALFALVVKLKNAIRINGIATGVGAEGTMKVEFLEELLVPHLKYIRARLHRGTPWQALVQVQLSSFDSNSIDEKSEEYAPVIEDSPFFLYTAVIGIDNKPWKVVVGDKDIIKHSPYIKELENEYSVKHGKTKSVEDDQIADILTRM